MNVDRVCKHPNRENSNFVPFCYSPSPSARFVANSVCPVITRAGDVGHGGEGDNTFATPYISILSPGRSR